jgi:outer membrane biosynthesis protein TonB
MRRILASSLLLSPLLFPAAAIASKPVDDASAPTQARTASSVTVPNLIHTTDVIVSPDLAGKFVDDSKIALKLNVDEQGMPRDIQVIDPANKVFDDEVVDAVRQFRWRPATLDKQPILSDLTLYVVVKR